ncbi:MAG: hypothetical protein ACD_11C00020G0052 [uncultured bacterium]|nr:MAG: hypothetical protein ACD_11C00020G0052 [uncultured bacterium]
MAKKYSAKFWIVFWTTSAIFLFGWYEYLQIDREKISSVIAPVLEFLPFDSENTDEYKNAAKISSYFLKKDGQEKTFLLLFQNNMEIRPGGGFIGAFGILKMKDGEALSVETHDLSNFDARIPDTVEPPYPMKETLRIKSWKLRDSNYSPDFEINAKKAEEFYHLGGGQEKFNGVIGITTNVLVSMLKVVGPIKLPDYPGVYDADNAVLMLEYQVEKAFEQQGIDRGERKLILKEMAEEIKNKVENLSISKKMELAKTILNDLKTKDIQFYFSDSELQNIARESNWTGAVDQQWTRDYLMTVDANLGAFKSDYYVQRSFKYSVDLSKEKPEVTLEITYNHTAKQKDFMTKDYLSYLRVYVPKGSWLVDSENFPNPRFGEELERKYFGAIVKVPLGTSKTIKLVYTLPEEIKNGEYDLKIQKQAGLNDVPVDIQIKFRDGSEKKLDFKLNQDFILGEK